MVLLCIAVLPLQSQTPPPKSKEDKRIARIAQIEKDYGVHFVQKAQVKVEGEVAEYWTFLKMDPQYSFQGYPFMVPANAPDKKVQEAIASALCCAAFYETFIERMKSAKPEATPSGYQSNNSYRSNI